MRMWCLPDVCPGWDAARADSTTRSGPLHGITEKEGAHLNGYHSVRCACCVISTVRVISPRVWMHGAGVIVVVVLLQLT